MLISPLNAFPWVINGLVEAYVSLKRVQSFLSLPELSLCHYYSPLLPAWNHYNGDTEERDFSRKRERHGHDVIRIINGCFSWKTEERTRNPSKHAEEPQIQELREWLLQGAGISIRTVHICECQRERKSKRERKGSRLKNWWSNSLPSPLQGEFVGVVGKVGSGKSSLLAAVMAEMRKKEGEVLWKQLFASLPPTRGCSLGQVMVADHHEGFALAAQEPWIQHATIRDNILFGRPFDRNRYFDVIYACALEPVRQTCTHSCLSPNTTHSLHVFLVEGLEDPSSWRHDRSGREWSHS